MQEGHHSSSPLGLGEFLFLLSAPFPLEGSSFPLEGSSHVPQLSVLQLGFGMKMIRLKKNVVADSLNRRGVNAESFVLLLILILWKVETENHKLVVENN
jgi:hypothetical protein